MKAKVKKVVKGNTWYYFYDKRTGGVAKVNSAVLIAPMMNMGFSRCSYAFYLRQRKLLPKPEQEAKMEVVKKGK